MASETSAVPGMFEDPGKDPVQAPRVSDGLRMRRVRPEDALPNVDLGKTPEQKMRMRLVLGAVMIPLAIIVATLIPNGMFVYGSNTPHDFAWWREALISNVAAMSNYVTGVADNNGIEFIFWRYCIVAVAGAGLAACGSMCQGTLKNYMASPSTLGVVSGGTLGAVLFVLLFGFQETAVVASVSTLNEQMSSLPLQDYLLAAYGRQLFSLVGCVSATALVLGVSYIAGHGRLSKVALIVIGQVVSAVVAAVTSLVRYWVTYEGTPEQLQAVVNLTSGVFANSVTPLDFAIVAVPVGVCLAVFLLNGRRFNLLAFSDEEARSMGLSVAGTRTVVMLLCALVTAVIVSFCGAIGFVGFMIPHFVRRLVGADFKLLLPASTVCGALFLVAAYFVVSQSNLLSGALGTVCTVVGSVLFVVVIVVQRRRGNVNWN